MKHTKGPQSKNAPIWLKKAHTSFRAQRNRCTNPNVNNYRHYGAKGIRVEYSWDDFRDWYSSQWASFTGKDPTVGRIDHLKNYSLHNIEMISRSDNAREMISRNGVPKRFHRDGLVPESRLSVIATDTTTRTERVFTSILGASKETGYSRDTIRRHCRMGKQKRTEIVFRFAGDT